MADVFAPQPIKTKTNGDAAVKIVDGTTVAQALAVDSSGAASVNNAKLAGTAVDVNSGTKSAGTQRVVLATDQPALTNALKVIGNGTAGTADSAVVTVQGIASMTALKVDLSSTTANATAVKVDGSAVTQPVSFGISGTVVDDYTTSSALAAGGTVTIDSTQIASGTGSLVEATVSASVALRAQLGTWDGTTFVVKRTFFVPANASLIYIPQRYDEIQKATGATAKFRWSITNMDNANAADVYASTTYWR